MAENLILSNPTHKDFDEAAIINKYKLDVPYDKLNDDQKKDIFHKLDNFLECVYLSPNIFSNDILTALKFREDRLSYWRFTGQVVGAIGFTSVWAFYKLRFHPSFYFRNLSYYAIFLGLSCYSFGRIFEFQTNIRYYREMILKMSVDYNISDDE